MLIAQGLYKTYKKYANEVRVLNGLDMEVRAGEFLSIVGTSGSGKSTLMHLLGTLDQPDQGAVLLDGYRIDCLPARERDRLAKPDIRIHFPVLSSAAGTEHAGKHAHAGHDRPFRATLVATEK